MKGIYFLSLIVVAALAWVFVNPPVAEPLPQSVASRATTSDLVTVPHATADSNLLEARRPPIPLMRNVKRRQRSPRPMSPWPMQTCRRRTIRDRNGQGCDRSGRIQTRKRDRKQGNGTWRAKAYRGQTEVSSR
jgi:hypothetical protein